MDKLTVANVDAHMGDRLAGAVFEEHQIAGLQLILADGHAVGELVGGGAVKGIAELAIDILGEAGTVKAAGAAAAVHVRSPQEVLGVGGDFLAHRGGGYGGGGSLGGEGNRC